MKNNFIMGCGVCRNTKTIQSLKSNLIINGDDLNTNSKFTMAEIKQIHNEKSLKNVKTRGRRGSLSNVIQLQDFPSNKMLKEINFARKKPLEYISIIVKYKKNIINLNGKEYLKIDDNNNNIKLNKGKENFDNCIEFLKEKLKKKLKLNNLIMSEDLKVPFPSSCPENCISQNYLQSVLIFKTSEIGNKINILDFHYDISISNNIELSTMMQIVDDTDDCTFQRRKNIFNSKSKFVGITQGNINEDLSCYYLMFGE